MAFEADRTRVVGLKAQTKNMPRKRARLCAHETLQDKIQEMIVAVLRESYIHPHKHRGKVESYHVIEGLADLIEFDDKGRITRVVPLGPYGSGRKFFYRNPRKTYHTLHVSTPIFIFHETTNGPFVPEETLWAKWAPFETDPDAVEKFRAKLDHVVRRRRGRG